MKMFLGEYNPNITEGSRLALPKRIREQIDGDSVVLTKGFEKCVYIYDRNDWAEQAQKYIDSSKVDSQESKIRDLERFVYASALEVSIDTQGRIVIPAGLLAYAQIDGKTSLVGVGNRVEIWNFDNWNLHLEKITKELSE